MTMKRISLVVVVLLLSACGQKMEQVDGSHLSGTYQGGLADLSFKSNGEAMLLPHTPNPQPQQQTYTLKDNVLVVTGKPGESTTYTVKKDGTLTTKYGDTFTKM